MDAGAAKFRAALIDRWKNRNQSLKDAVDGAFSDAAGPWANQARPLLIQAGYGGLHFDECNQDDMNMPNVYD
jgi:hypothetical protein